MKTNRLLIKVAFSSVFAASAFIFTPGVVMAQVKIGSNPANIGTSSNLEVESSNGTKTIIDKSTGAMGINITSPTNILHVKATSDPLRLEGLQTGSTNDRILSVDVNGVVRATPASQTVTAPYVRVNGVVTTGTNNFGNTPPAVIGAYLTKYSYKFGTASNTSNVVVQESGLYYIACTTIGAKIDPNYPVTINDHQHSVMVNGTTTALTSTGRNSGNGIAVRAGSSATSVGLYALTAGDIITITLITVSDSNSNGDYEFDMSLFKISN